jgi:hypothetical protein
MTSHFLSYFKKQLETAIPCTPYLSGMTREEQIDTFTKMLNGYGASNTSTEEVERLLDQKLIESSNHVGDIKLFMMVFHPDEFRVEAKSFWLSEANQIEQRYSFMDMPTESMPRFKKL